MSDGGSSNEPGSGQRGKGLMMGVGLLAAAAALFGVCSAVQGAYGSSMLAASYSDPGLLGELLINVTFWPGWLGTVVLAGSGALEIIGSFLKD